MLHHPFEFVILKASQHLPGEELYSAPLVDCALAPHLHDGYPLGTTEAGIERFRYQFTQLQC